MIPIIIAAALCAGEAGPPAPPPSVIETHRGVIQGKFDQFGGFGNATKEFYLINGWQPLASSKRLAFPSPVMYRRLEQNDGNVVIIDVIRATHGNEVWYVAIDFEVVEEIKPDEEK